MTFLLAFGATAALTPLVAVLARRLGWVALPREDRWHRRPTALAGGIAIFLGSAAAWLAAGAGWAALPVLAPAGAMFLLGLVDDRVVELRPLQKLAGQTLIAGAAVAQGIVFPGLPPAVSVPLTVLWIVGITNAVNLLDNMDGLAAGVSALSAGFLAAYCFQTGREGEAAAALGLAGACAAFLLFNFPPARVFMGDCGSLFIGVSLAILAVQGTHAGAPNALLALLVPAAALAIPIFDTGLVAFARAFHGRPIMPGNTDHASHRLVTLGLSERATVLLLYALAALFGALALRVGRLPPLTVGVTAALLIVALANVGLYLGVLNCYTGPSGEGAGAARGLRPFFYRQHRFVELVLDAVLVPVAWIGAHLLRFEGDLPPYFQAGVFAALPIVLAAKLAALGLCRAYRGLWSMAGAGDAFAAFGGATLGAVAAAAIIGLTMGYRQLSRGAMIMDWLLFAGLVVLFRMGNPLLRWLFGMVPSDRPRAVILGLGEPAFSLTYRLRDPLAAERFQLVGILDDDRNKAGRALNGVPVLGPVSLLPGLREQGRAACCFLGVAPGSNEGAEILRFCSERGIVVYQEPGRPLTGGEGPGGEERLHPVHA